MTNREYLNSSNPYICIDNFFFKHIHDSSQSVTIVICILIFVILIIHVSNYHQSLKHDKKYLLKKTTNKTFIFMAEKNPA